MAMQDPLAGNQLTILREIWDFSLSIIILQSAGIAVIAMTLVILGF